MMLTTDRSLEKNMYSAYLIFHRLNGCQATSYVMIRHKYMFDEVFQ